MAVIKCELPGADALGEKLAESLADRTVLINSSVTGQGLDRLLRSIVAELDRAEAVINDQ